MNPVPVLQLTGIEELSVAYLTVFCVAALLFFIIWIYVCIWVYRDAEKRGSSGALWALLVFFFGLIPLIIWLIVRPPIAMYPQAGYGYMPPPPGAMYQPCPFCGRPMSVVPQYNRWYCHNCGKYP